MPYEEQQLAALYGPEAKISDHKRGQIIAYLAHSGQPRRGEIIWVCAAGQALVSGKEMLVHYIVSSGHGWPDIVYPGEVIQDTDDEPALAHSLPDTFKVRGRNGPLWREKSPERKGDRADK